MKTGPYSAQGMQQAFSSRAKMTPAAFHNNKVVECDTLLLLKPLNFSSLKVFVDNYNQQFKDLFPNLYSNNEQKNALFKKISEHCFKYYTEKLRVFSADNNNTLVELVPILEQFLFDFPEGEKSLIHYQNNKVFETFSQQLQTALSTKLGESGRFQNTKSTPSMPPLCVEALLLQSLAKLPLATSLPSIVLNDYGKIIAEFARRATNYLNGGSFIKSAATVTMTASALSRFDIEAFAVVVSDNHPYMPKICKRNVIIEDFINACIRNIQPKTTPMALIRIMHDVSLLSPATDRKTYLTSDIAKKHLDRIAVELKLDPKPNAQDRALASQLFILKNIYSDVFPQTLANEIATYLNAFQQQAHGSAFERIIGKEITLAATQLAETYPGLINPTLFDFENPISDELGMESDVTYLDGDLKVCVQIDGDKYHRHLGSNSETQRTKLRDFCFQSQGWKIAKFSDSAHGGSHATQQLLESIVIPTFEIKTQKNIAAILQADKEIKTLALDGKLGQIRATILERFSSFDAKGANDLATMGAQLKNAEAKLVFLTTENVRLQDLLTSAGLSSEVKIKKEEMLSAKELVSTLQTEYNELESGLKNAISIAHKAKENHEKYDHTTNKDSNITRQSLKNDRLEAEDARDKLRTALQGVVSKQKDANSKAEALERDYGKLQKAQEDLSSSMEKSCIALSEAKNKVESMLAALSAPIVGTDLLDAYAAFKKEMANPKSTQPKFNINATPYTPSKAAASFLPVAQQAPIATTTSQQNYAPAGYPTPHHGMAPMGANPYGYTYHYAPMPTYAIAGPQYYPGTYYAPRSYYAPAPYYAYKPTTCSAEHLEQSQEDQLDQPRPLIFRDMKDSAKPFMEAAEKKCEKNANNTPKVTVGC